MATTEYHEQLDKVRKAFMGLVHSLPQYEASGPETDGNKYLRVRLIREVFACGLKEGLSVEESLRFFDKR
jgi:hypothetical protein